ncbi:MAG: hypothetical protein JKY86_11825 [Gammaproteobacteria bacterium]|nr:hypothetical protein [Gammaproteobacteria bacterium]
MNLEKSKKRISKKAKMGFQGYPTIEITYLGPNDSLAIEVLLELVPEEGAEPQTERFTTTNDIREDATIQSAIVKMIERSGAQSVILSEGVTFSGAA